MYFFYLRKLSQLRGHFYSTALVQSNICHKKCLITNAIPTFLSKQKKYITRFFLCNFMRPKTSDKLSVNIDHLQ